MDKKCEICYSFLTKKNIISNIIEESTILNSFTFINDDLNKSFIINDEKYRQSHFDKLKIINRSIIHSDNYLNKIDIKENIDLKYWLEDTICFNCINNFLDIFESRLELREIEQNDEEKKYENSLLNKKINVYNFEKVTNNKNKIIKYDYKEEIFLKKSELLEKTLIKYIEQEYELNKLNEINMLMSKKNNFINEQLKKFKMVNLKNNLFMFNFDNDIAKINGLRIGQTKIMNVSWLEINSAMGEILLLLNLISNMYNFKDKNLEIIPNGSMSFILERNKKYILFGKNEFGINLNKLLLGNFSNNYDNGLYCLVKYVKNLYKHAIIRSPFKLDDGRIDMEYIYTYKNTKDNWTLLMKKLLINIKYLYDQES